MGRRCNPPADESDAESDDSAAASAAAAAAAATQVRRPPVERESQGDRPNSVADLITSPKHADPLNGAGQRGEGVVGRGDATFLRGRPRTYGPTRN